MEIITHNDIKSLKINNTVANTFNEYFLTVVDTVIGNIKRGNSDPRDNVNPSNYLINNFNSTFQELIVTMPQLIKFIRLSNH